MIRDDQPDNRAVNMNTIPLTLYIHIPWCLRKCPYCDFNSHVWNPDMQQEYFQKYLKMLLLDLENELPSIWGRGIEAVFFGGGTPSLLPPQLLDDLISALRARLRLTQALEITLEANPGTVDYQRFADFRQAGVNRLSIGVQSFNDTHLRALGRIHQAKEAILAVEAAHRAGFENINLDLMYALPRQTLEQSRADLQQALALQVQHISWYQLTLEPHTHFAAFPPPLPDEEQTADIILQGFDLLQAAGFQRYEISAWSQAGFSCRHNLNYWQFGDYLGIGAGAHAKISQLAENKIYRSWKLKHPEQYLRGRDRLFLGEKKTLSKADLIFEFMLNCTRLTAGVPQQLFEQRTGLELSEIEPLWQQACEAGLLTLEDGRVKSTALGLRFLNNLQAVFL